MDNAGENSSNVALWSNGSATCKYTRNEITLRPFYHIVAKKICSQLHLLECTFLHCTFFVALLLLFSVVSHCVLLPRRSCWSPERGLLSDSPGPSLWLVRRLGWSTGCAASDAISSLGSFSL